MKDDRLTGSVLFNKGIGTGGQETNSDYGSVTSPVETPTAAQLRQKTSGSGVDAYRSPEQAGEIRDICQQLACRARDAFKDACSSISIDEAEASLASTKGHIEELWEYAYLRDRPFRDLLALLDAALKRAALPDLNTAQRDVLRQAFADLPRWMLEDATVDDHIDRFAEHDVDIIGPLRATRGKRFVVSFEEVKSDGDEASVS
ncbi:MAG: hypothetical protein FJ271_16280 [Planctomycetes bacterium]|nr:hypothetical protein [Planctomycetota bacterium]